MKKNNILIIALVIVIIGLSGFIIYDKALSNDKEVIVDKNNDGNLDNGNNTDTDNNSGNVNTDNNNNKDDEDIEVVVKDNDSDVEKVTGNYKDYTEDCSYGNEKCTISYTFKSNNNYKSVVEVEDTFAVVSMSMFGKQIYILHDGYLYYDIEECNENGNCDYIKYNLYHTEENTSKLKKFDKLSNIKRIISFNDTTGVSYDLFLITDDGNVYTLTYDMINNNFNFRKTNNFLKYNVDDIVYYGAASGPGGSEFDVILKDGTILTKSINRND